MIRIGIICPSEIAFRRFLPALQKDSRFVFAGIGVASAEEWYGDNFSYNIIANETRLSNERAKAQEFINICQTGKIFNSYESLVKSDDVDAVYLPLPPVLHYKWTDFALKNGKHAFVEKPFTTNASDTNKLVSLAQTQKLAIHENYMFIYHDQIRTLKDLVEEGYIGDVRLYRITFGFPRRAQNDFRYNKALGGGALIDAGGYTVKYASYLLGPTAKVVTAHLNYIPDFDVDIYGTATMVNDKGTTAQLAFGMDCDYKCEIEIWGSKGTIVSNRVLTAPAGFTPKYVIKKNQEYESRFLPSDDAFLKSIDRFYRCIVNDDIRQEEYSLVQMESNLLTDVINMANQ